jgi:CheY-like chemotaxis protein
MQGFEVVIAANGIDTLQALSQRGFDLILMDVQIPLMSGIEATIAIGAKEKFTGEHIPIIAVTALDQQ